MNWLDVMDVNIAISECTMHGAKAHFADPATQTKMANTSPAGVLGGSCQTFNIRMLVHHRCHGILFCEVDNRNRVVFLYPERQFPNG